MIWIGAGLHGFMLAVFLIMQVLDINPDKSSAKFLFSISPLLLLFGIILTKLSYKLQNIWMYEQGVGYKFNKLCAIGMCDFSYPPSLFFIPLHYWSFIAILAGFEEWIRVGLM